MIWFNLNLGFLEPNSLIGFKVELLLYLSKKKKVELLLYHLIFNDGTWKETSFSLWNFSWLKLDFHFVRKNSWQKCPLSLECVFAARNSIQFPHPILTIYQRAHQTLFSFSFFAYFITFRLKPIEYIL